MMAPHSRKRKRWQIIGGGAAVLLLTLGLLVSALDQSLSYFYYPSEIPAPRPLQSLRIGGDVGTGSISHPAPMTTRFAIVDGKGRVMVRYAGILPDLFREGQGVIVEGSFTDGEGDFIARKVLAKHDENYRPPRPMPGEEP